MLKLKMTIAMEKELGIIDLGDVNCIVCGEDIYEMREEMPVHEHCYKGNETKLNKIRENARRGLIIA